MAPAPGEDDVLPRGARDGRPHPFAAISPTWLPSYRGRGPGVGSTVPDGSVSVACPTRRAPLAWRVSLLPAATLTTDQEGGHREPGGWSAERHSDRRLSSPMTPISASQRQIWHAVLLEVSRSAFVETCTYLERPSASCSDLAPPTMERRPRAR